MCIKSANAPAEALIHKRMRIEQLTRSGRQHSLPEIMAARRKARARIRAAARQVREEQQRRQQLINLLNLKVKPLKFQTPVLTRRLQL